MFLQGTVFARSITRYLGQNGDEYKKRFRGSNPRLDTLRLLLHHPFIEKRLGKNSDIRV